MTPPRIGSLCSGYGGLELGLMGVVGGTVAWHAENDKHASRVLAERFPDVPNHGDITAVDWAAVEPVEVVCAGFPCQDISGAGRGEGIVEGNRSGLWYAIVDALRVLRPRLIVLENVAALVARRPGLDVVLGSLATLGFDADWVCVRAADAGAPHLRDRWFCVAYAAGGGVPDLTPRGGVGLVSLSAEPRTGDGALVGTRAPRTGLDRGRARVMGAPARPGQRFSGAARQRQRDGHTALDCGAEATDAADTDRPGQQGSGPTWATGGGFAPGPHSPWGPYTAAIGRWEHLTRPAPPAAVSAPKGGQRLNPAFSEWMMGLPAGWVTEVLPRNPALSVIGNGVCPQQAALALRLLLHAEAAA